MYYIQFFIETKEEEIIESFGEEGEDEGVGETSSSSVSEEEDQEDADE